MDINPLAGPPAPDGNDPSSTGTPPNAPAPQPDAQAAPSASPVTNPPAPQSPQAQHDGIIGRTLHALSYGALKNDVLKAPEMMGKAFKALTGQQTQYSIDPNTGQTVETKVQNTPGQCYGRRSSCEDRRG